MEVLIVVDMQEAVLLGDVKYDLSSLIERINRLAGRVRARGGCVIFIQHDGGPGEEWAILSSIDKKPGDRVVRKTLNDAFFGTSSAIGSHAAGRRAGSDGGLGDRFLRGRDRSVGGGPGVQGGGRRRLPHLE